jgi:hypothetical protein
MKRSTCLAGLAVLVGLTANAAEIAGVRIDDRVDVGGRELVLNGAGLRKVLWFRIYVAALYLTEKQATATEVLRLPGPKCVRLTLMRDFPGRELVKALTDGINDDSTADERRRLHARVHQFGALLRSLGRGIKGDNIALDYVPGSGTIVRFNDEAVGGPIPGADFYQALLRVWLGKHAASRSLRRALLGG